MNYRIKEILWILSVWVIFLVIPYVISKFGLDYKNMLCSSWWLYAILFLGTSTYFIFPEGVRNLFCKICEKKIEDTTGVSSALETRDNKNIKEFKEEIQKSKTIITEAPDTTKEIHSKEKDLNQLSKDFNDKKYEKVILDATNKLKSDINDEKEYCYRIFMELAYSEMNTSQYIMDDRIENLKIIINHKQTQSKAIQFRFMLMLSQCYLQQHKLTEALSFSYKTLYKMNANKEKCSSNLFATLYHLQAKIFISQDKPIQAISIAKMGLKFADEKRECDLCYLISSAYFNYLNKTKDALFYALKSWAKIYPGAQHQSNLVYLCYFSYFFEGQYSEAAEFLENYTITEKKNKYYANLSYLFYKIDNFNQATEYAEKAIEDEKKGTVACKDVVAARNTLAMLAMNEKNYEKAIYLFSEILPSFEEDKDSRYGKYFYSEILYNRGKCYAELGNYQKANDDINAAMKLGFENIDARLFEEIQYNVINSRIESTKLITDKTEKENNSDAE